MQAASFEEDLEKILAADQRYHKDAYIFIVREALDHTRKLVNKGKSERKGNHVSTLELLEGIRECALAQFGPMAITVLDEWGVRSCQDFGEMVFLMIEHRILAKNDDDSPADFQKGYSFYEAFRKPFLPMHKLPKALPEPKPAQA
jgi:uncharacterized repeat protein (TIGR04138 family)